MVSIYGIKLPQAFFLSIIGVFCGSMMMVFLQTLFASEKIIGKDNLVLSLWFGCAVVGAVILLELYKKIRRVVQCLPITEHTKNRFLKYHILTYLIFLGYGLVWIGIKPYLSFALLLFTFFAIIQIFLLWLSADATQKERWSHSPDVIPILFLISGFAALIYQVVWQRVLFTTFGSNIESVTVIVSVFMFGLGIGALAGGQIQRYLPHRLLECFIAIELAIGMFGIFSITLIHKISQLAPHDSLFTLILTTYGLLALPTMLMGSTLPLLVNYLQKRYVTLGATVGKLYAYNTFGSAFASFLTVMLLFTVVGQQTTIFIAAACNALTAYLVWFFCRKNISESKDDAVKENVRTFVQPFSYRAALLLSLFIGYISLSLEILWFRVLGFMTANLPQVFGTLLAVFLTGIALGSLKAKRWSESGKDTNIFITQSLLWIAIITYISLPWTAFLASNLVIHVGYIAGYIATGLLAYFSGGIFPLLCQTGTTSEQRAGTTVSWIYFFNIVGATLGSLITGFILLDKFTLAQNMMIIFVVVITLLVILHRKQPLKLISAYGALTALAFLLFTPLYNDIISQLQGFPKGITTKYISENRHGIITVFADEPNDMIFGNGAYDGKFNIDPTIKKSNTIERAYLVSALHPNPKRILEIGVSSGSWARVLSLYAPLEELVSIEINPGYLDIMAHYSQIAPVLQHPKWTSHIDDGRRWLMNHPNERFDAIVMNTTFYWRMNASNLLSKEFLTLCKQHLNPGGILYYNTTDARDNVYTVAHVFKHVTTYLNMVAASDAPFDLSYAHKKKNLSQFGNTEGHPIFFTTPQYQETMEELAKKPLKDTHDSILAEKDLWLITDDNMASEYKIEHGPFPPTWYQ